MKFLWEQDINRIGPGKRVNGKSGKAETTIFWPYYSGKCRTIGTVGGLA